MFSSCGHSTGSILLLEVSGFLYMTLESYRNKVGVRHQDTVYKSFYLLIYFEQDISRVIMVVTK